MYYSLKNTLVSWRAACRAVHVPKNKGPCIGGQWGEMAIVESTETTLTLISVEWEQWLQRGVQLKHTTAWRRGRGEGATLLANSIVVLHVHVLELAL